MRAGVGRVVLVVSLAWAFPVVAQEAPEGTILVANMNDDSVWLIDARTGTHRATVETHIAPHEVAISSDGRIAAVTNYGDQRGPGNVIQFIDIAAGTVTHEISIEGYERLHGAAFLEDDEVLALTSERTGEILIVSADDGEIRRTLSTGGRASHMLALGGEWIFAANIADGTVSRMDPSGEGQPLVWSAGTTRTEGIAVTADGSEVWTASMDAGIVVGVDGVTGEILARLDGFTIPYRLAATPDGETVVISDPDAGMLVLIDRHEGAVSASVDVDAASAAAGLGDAASPQGFYLSPDGAWAFVSANAIGQVALVHLPSARVIRFVGAGAAPDGIAFSPVTGR